MEIGSRRILHFNVTQHPTAEWTTQQFREFLAFDQPYRFSIHDRDSIFSPTLDKELRGFGVRVLKAPVRAPKANAFCERLIGTIRREYLDFLIPMNERHLRSILKEYVTHYHRGRPHSSLGPGIPEPPQAQVPAGPQRHKLPNGYRVTSTRFSAACTMNMVWERRLLSDRSNFADHNRVLDIHPESSYTVGFCTLSARSCRRRLSCSTQSPFEFKRQHFNHSRSELFSLD
jgi:hypothetical protein